ncbi:MetQ/NlpA family ABC transporter substrate-binding protein [Kurthia sibirica]|uniref:Lipoprotein n=1 Tax=Kurthia sibirica TaxID=202750 RepID=A0A2U3APQ9_9BACL|nr:MetQ/NlpA family ABC transporter substrate-binding protein [Kurthia sibirica]PWI26522.1 metal ABC transporter substrate-binding protein [Kurthia sibirica]GEK32766.1 lipoprotein [Kurthia sibirica]
MKKTAGIILSLSLAASVLAACGNDKKDDAAAGSDDKLIVGVTGGPHEKIAREAAKVAKEDGLDVELKVFSDYVLPNTSLEQGDLDANSFQTLTFLANYNAEKKGNLVSVGTTILTPMGLYSKKVKSLDKLKDGSKIAIPNDASNGARALEVLVQNKLITLKDTGDTLPTPKDIDKNPHQFTFVELEASQLPRQLDEVDAAVINTNFVLEAGMDTKSALAVESTDSPHINAIVVEKSHINDADVKKFVKAYHSETVKKYIEKEFDGAVIPVFNK